MPSRKTHPPKSDATIRWHALPHGHRVAILGLVALSLLGLLSSLRFAGASGNTGVQFMVTASGFTINFIATPEKRIPSTGNKGTLVTVEVRDPGSTTALFSRTVNTGSGGTYSGMTIALYNGTYDITAKGYSHLRIKKSSQILSNGITIDFTAAGSSPLLSGDVNGSNGDNVVSSADLTEILTGLSAYNVRYDLNRDGRINGMDLTNAVSNLDATGAS